MSVKATEEGQMETEPTSNSRDDKKDPKDEKEFCPLFMEGLPADFETNPALAALASLLDSDSDNEEDKKRADAEKAKALPKPGGGKVRRSRSNHYRSNRNPYNIPEEKKKKKASVGEAQLFLNMWKLS